GVRVRVPLVPLVSASLFDNAAAALSAHDVTAACLLPRQGVRVQLPLGALKSGNSSVWLERMLREHQAVGSSPTSPTEGPMSRGVMVAQPVVTRKRAGSSPAGTVLMEGQANGRWQPSRKRPSASLEGSTPSPSAGDRGSANW